MGDMHYVNLRHWMHISEYSWSRGASQPDPDDVRVTPGAPQARSSIVTTPLHTASSHPGA